MEVQRGLICSLAVSWDSIVFSCMIFTLLLSLVLLFCWIISIDGLQLRENRSRQEVGWYSQKQFQQNSSHDQHNPPWTNSWCPGTTKQEYMWAKNKKQRTKKKKLTKHMGNTSYNLCTGVMQCTLVRRGERDMCTETERAPLTFPPIRKSSARSWNWPCMSPHIVTGHFTGCYPSHNVHTYSSGFAWLVT